MVHKKWDTITIEQYVAIHKTKQDVQDTPEQLLNLLIKRYCIIENFELEDAEKLEMNELYKVHDFMKSEMPVKIVKMFRLNYQSLVTGKPVKQLYKVKLNPSEYSSGEYMAVMNSVKDPIVNESMSNLHRLLFLICRPINRWGKEIEVPPCEIDGMIESFKQLPLQVARPIEVFFYNLSNDLTDLILLSSVNQMTKTKEMMEKEISCLEDTDG